MATKMPPTESERLNVSVLKFPPHLIRSESKQNSNYKTDLAYARQDYLESMQKRLVCFQRISCLQEYGYWRHTDDFDDESNGANHDCCKCDSGENGRDSR